MVAYRPIDEVVDFITSLPSPQAILDFRPSSALQERVEDLLYKKQTTLLTYEEDKEMEQYLLIEHIMRMAKKRAKQRLNS